MIHNVFGDIRYEYLWIGKYTINLFGNESEGLLNISGENNGEFDENQIEAFKMFESNKLELSKKIEDAVYKYYLDVNEEYRDRYGNEADKYAPKIESIEELESLIKFEALNLPYSFVENERIVGILFKSKWEVEHGIAVKLVNEEVVEVGYQDIVL